MNCGTIEHINSEIYPPKISTECHWNTIKLFAYLAVSASAISPERGDSMKSLRVSAERNLYVRVLGNAADHALDTGDLLMYLIILTASSSVVFPPLPKVIVPWGFGRIDVCQNCMHSGYCFFHDSKQDGKKNPLNFVLYCTRYLGPLPHL